MSHPIRDFQTHFLLPFRYEWRKLDQLKTQLKAMRWNGQVLWDDAPPELPHLDNILPTLQLGETIAALQLTSAATNLLNLVGEPFEDIPIAKLCDELRAVVYLTHYGVGVFLISLKPDSTTDLTVEKVMKFNHFHHWGLTNDYPTAQQRPRPMLSSGMTSSQLPLIDLIHLLLPLETSPGNAQGSSPIGLRKFQRGLSIYTSVRIDSTIDLKDETTRQSWISPMAKLQRVMLPTFSDISWDAISENTLQLNDRHWICLGQLGAAHLISEQPEEQHKAQGYPDYRFTHSLRKMFLPYLLALLQRLSLQVFNGEAIVVIDANREKPDEAHMKMELLRTTLMDFTLRFQPDLLTNEDNGTSIYRHAQKVLGVHDTQQRLHRALADVDSQRIARHQVEVQRNQDKVQHNMHWLELFIFTVYVVELTSHLSHAFGGHKEPSWFTGWGLVIAIAVAIVAAAIQLKLHLFHKHPVRDDGALKRSWRAWFSQFEKRWLIMALIGLAIGIIIYLDNRIAATESKEGRTSAPPNEHSSAAPHSNSPVEIATPRVSLQLDPALEPLTIRVSPADSKAAIESPAHLPPAESEHK